MSCLEPNDDSNVNMRSSDCRLVCGVGELERVKQVLERVVEVEEKAFGSNADEMVSSLVCLGSVYNDLGDSEKAKRVLERGVSLIRSNFGGSDPRMMSSALSILAGVHRSLGEAGKANQLMSEALLLRRGLQDQWK